MKAIETVSVKTRTSLLTRLHNQRIHMMGIFWWKTPNSPIYAIEFKLSMASTLCSRNLTLIFWFLPGIVFLCARKVLSWLFTGRLGSNSCTRERIYYYRTKTNGIIAWIQRVCFLFVTLNLRPFNIRSHPLSRESFHNWRIKICLNDNQWT